MTEAPFVAFRDVTRRWDGRGGVDAVSLTVARGAFVSILGPSGCGKSTLLRLLAGLERPQSGEILIDGAVVNDAPASQRGLSMVFQSYALFPHLTVRENILFGMKARRVPRATREAKLAEALRMMALEGLERRKPSELSGGQRQRVALARAVVAGRPLCLMDEPLSNLDAQLRTSVRRDIKALQRQLDLTIVYVTHDQAEAMTLSDRIVLMREGRVEQIATPQELYEKPATPFAARFIGDPPMALIDGAALGRAEIRTIGIRPEKIAPSEAARADLPADLTAEIEAVEFLGAQTRLILKHPRAEGLALTLPGHAPWPIGATVGLRLPEEHRVPFEQARGAVEKDPQQDRGEGVANRSPVIAERRTLSITANPRG